MLPRRRFMQSGLAAVAGVLWARRARAAGGGSCTASGGLPADESSAFRYLHELPESRMVDGLPFAPWFGGDDFDNTGIPFHVCENCFDGGAPPPPQEEADIVIAGGGISGLSTAYLLREHRPVLLEMHDHVGGAAQGEVWGRSHYSLGGAYIITPDKGTFLESLYQELGLPDVVRVDDGDLEVELNGEEVDGFFQGAGFQPEDLPALQRYAEVVTNMAENDYPDIPLPEGGDNSWILELDNRSFHQDIQMQMGMPIPTLLAAAIQGYCYSSFAAGWDEISAASGWNFLAAEEFGRWVFPGGNAYIAQAMWRALVRLDRLKPPECRPYTVRSRCLVVDVRKTAGKRVQVTYRDSEGVLRGILAKRVVMCMPKHVAKYIIHDLAGLDGAKASALQHLEYRAYMMANVLLDAPISPDFYDIFLLDNAHFPMTGDEFALQSRVVDVLNGDFAGNPSSPRSVLTLYWPLPFPSGRFTMLDEHTYENYTSSFAAQMRSILGVLDLPLSAVKQIRMARWGHALPVAAVGLIADGTLELVRRPIDDKIFFVEQDNWALPAVENCLLDAHHFAPQIAAGLRRFSVGS